MKNRKAGLGKKTKLTSSNSQRKTRSAKPMRLGRRRSITTKQKQTSPRVTSAISKMRTGASLRKASRESGVAPRTVLKRAASALRKNKNGRYIPRTNDRLVRPLKIPTPQGAEEINVRGLRAASLLGRYWEAVHKYYATGEVAAFQNFQGQFITAVGGVKYPLLTDIDVLNQLGSAGEFSFESLYAGVDA